MEKLAFFVPGMPATAGSKTPFIYKDKKTGKSRVSIAPANKRQKPWMGVVRLAAQRSYKKPPATGPIVLTIIFHFTRPKSHFGTGKNINKLKPSAPAEHIKKPDLTKLTRAIEDALSGVVWKDDSQVVKQNTYKKYSKFNGALIKIDFEV